MIGSFFFLDHRSASEANTSSSSTKPANAPS
ncbi:uncharacterized protein METZ01_LOCUS394399 [marine metagenome]|uniref:Uncharacterized protein n=1 Tax=marine metagenome TaxID=408172 RepID=A0A382V697_9ZZZZ